ncbi:TetR family transcriptional regulator C-terminal domain-containing protein [Streptomyces benahoarensis]|uniref:TetR family transcriptional regulator C-terminal domain-containing protein n=1 Tax=Streptomyces benahoarensis TaxID=2595054 RepID=UPI0020354A75|nr:TetR family transcriptional regulator C-terminal domain-containing protein [Streptomyces benahoarensis]
MEFTLHAARHPEVARALAVHEERLNTGIAGVLARCLERTGRAPEVSALTLARLVAAFFEGLTAMEVTHTGDRDTPALVHRALPHLVRALSRPEEQKG